MKATKMRNKQFYRASFTTLSSQVAAHLSKELQKKYSKRSIRLTEGDNVKIVRGEYKGVDGKVTKVSTIKNSVVIEGVKKEKSKGEKFDVYTRASNVIVTDLNSDDKWRIYKLEGKKPKSIPKEPKIKPEKSKDQDVKQKTETKSISKTTTTKKEKSDDIKNKITKKNTERKSEK